MDKREILRENTFLEIAKLLALHQLRRKLPGAMKQVEDSPPVQAAMLSLKYTLEELDKELKYACEKWPDSELCKKKNKSK